MAAEYEFTKAIAVANVKNYQLWNHRRKCAEVRDVHGCTTTCDACKEMSIGVVVLYQEALFVLMSASTSESVDHAMFSMMAINAIIEKK